MSGTAPGGAPARFPAGFTWGAATSAHQVEGGMDLDAGGRSIWDTFAETPGKVRGGDLGARGVGHRTRMREDVALMAGLGITAYRFSIAWPRVQPGGRGPANRAGLDFYRELLDALHAHGIEAVATLYHWDLPQELEDAGGWPVRATAERFAEYAALAGRELGDGVAAWRTINEPWCSAMLGYAAGVHAPGRTDPAAAVAAAHHLLLGHGLAVDALRAAIPAGTPVGITLNPYPVRAAGGTDADRDAVRRVDGIANRIWFEPVLRGAYPDDVVADLEPLGFSAHVRDGDLDVVSRPLDAVGLNYYRRHHVRSVEGASAVGPWPGSTDIALVEPEGPHTDGGWAIEPDGLVEALEEVAAYDPPALYVEECGAAFDDEVGADGGVHDDRRVAFLRDHLLAAHRAVEAGLDLRGWFVWTLLDNFEWAEGYAHRFGVVHVDHQTLERTPKDSAHWYAEVARTGVVDPRALTRTQEAQGGPGGVSGGRPATTTAPPGAPPSACG